MRYPQDQPDHSALSLLIVLFFSSRISSITLASFLIGVPVFFYAMYMKFLPVFLLGVQLGESPLRRLQPVPLVVFRLSSLDNVKRVNDSSLLTQILFTLVKQIPVNQD